jgi:hypothetical protein
MEGAYRNCHNLTGHPICGQNVIEMRNAYTDCPNLASNAYFYSPSVSMMYNCFVNWPNTKYLNIYVPTNSITLNNVLLASDSSIVGANITWTNDTINNRYYNTQYNVYVYPVENVAAARTANGDD